MDAIFKALADESRRALLDALRVQDGLTLTELCGVLPQMTRFGVSSHLRVLEASGLVTAVKDGRRVRHHLNPLPLREIQHRWLSEFTAETSDRLIALRNHLERKAPAMQTHVFVVYIAAPRQAVWDELTSTGTTRPWLYDSITTATWQPGTRYEQRSADGTLLIEGEVFDVVEPERLALGFDCHWDAVVAAESGGRLTYELAEVDGQTKLTVTTTAGPATASEAVEGTPWIYSQLKTLLESASVANDQA